MLDDPAPSDGGVIVASQSVASLSRPDGPLDRRFEAIVLDGAAAPERTGDANRLRGRVSEKSETAQWLFEQLWRIGIGPGLVLVVGDASAACGGISGSDSLLLAAAARATAVSVGLESSAMPEGVIAAGGGLDALLEILEDQIVRRRRRDPPRVDDDPGWAIVADGLDPPLERVRESWLTVGDGRIATRGSSVVPHPAGNPSVLAAGVYHGLGSKSELMAAPLWNLVGGRLNADDAGSRTLDLHTGVLHERLGGPGGQLDAVLFSSLARPGTAALRVATSDRTFAWSDPLADPIDGIVPTAEPASSTSMSASGRPGGVSVAASQRAAVHRDGAGLERLAAYATDPRHRPRASTASRRLRAAERVGFEWLLHEHRAQWAQRWEDAGVEIVGDEALQRAVRFALFHLIGSVADRGEAAVGARGLTGSAYRGHVFWDLRIAAGIDLDDITQTTAAGLHLAAMGGTWQALALGFAGLRPEGGTLCISPRLPAAWESLAVPVRFRGVRLRIEITRTAVTVRADHSTSVRIDGGEAVTVSPPASRFPLDAGGPT